MQTSVQELFSPQARNILAEWGLSPNDDEMRIHLALTSRTLSPEETHLRAAAIWLQRIFSFNAQYPHFDNHALGQLLGDKAALLLRMAYRHVPPLAVEFERPDSPLRAIDAAARFLPPWPPLPSAHLAELRQDIAAIDLPTQPPAGSDPTWHENRRRLRNLVLHDNPARFLSWPVVVNSMFMNDHAIAEPELQALQARPDYTTRWLPALREDALGAPARTSLHAESSNNLIHHAYNLLQLEQHTKVKLEHLSSILEFGGGYGSTTRLAYRLGFRGKYVIFDLPEFSALQRFYLGTLGFPVGTAIQCVNSFHDLKILLPAPDLFLATWSFSETPICFRSDFLLFLLSARHLLFGYQEAFGDADNLCYFAEISHQLIGKAICDYPIAHLPKNRYFVAAPRTAPQV